MTEAIEFEVEQLDDKYDEEEEWENGEKEETYVKSVTEKTITIYYPNDDQKIR